MTIRLLALAAILTTASGCSGLDEETTTNDALSVTPSTHPIVLAHGFDGSVTNRWSFYGVKDLLTAKGMVVHEAQVAPFNTVTVRASQLATHVDQAIAECRLVAGCDASKVHVIAHSMGGLDARYMISKLGYGDRVASLTTISTPHRGSNVADIALNLLPGSESDAGRALNAVSSAFARTFTAQDLAQGSALRGALESISEGYVNGTFDRDVADDPRVTYLSWAGVSGIATPSDDSACEGKFEHSNGRDLLDSSLAANAAFVTKGRLAPNDGMVLVTSAKWGKFMGCIAGDHLDEVGQPHHDRPNFFGGFDHKAFYVKVALGLDHEVALHDAQR